MLPFDQITHSEKVAFTSWNKVTLMAEVEAIGLLNYREVLHNRGCHTPHVLAATCVISLVIGSRSMPKWES